jgi:hypothetical protein
MKGGELNPPQHTVQFLPKEELVASSFSILVCFNGVEDADTG